MNFWHVYYFYINIVIIFNNGIYTLICDIIL